MDIKQFTGILAFILLKKGSQNGYTAMNLKTIITLTLASIIFNSNSEAQEKGTSPNLIIVWVENPGY